MKTHRKNPDHAWGRFPMGKLRGVQQYGYKLSFDLDGAKMNVTISPVEAVEYVRDRNIPDLDEYRDPEMYADAIPELMEQAGRMEREHAKWVRQGWWPRPYPVEKWSVMVVVVPVPFKRGEGLVRLDSDKPFDTLAQAKSATEAALPMLKQRRRPAWLVPEAPVRENPRVRKNMKAPYWFVAEGAGYRLLEHGAPTKTKYKTIAAAKADVSERNNAFRAERPKKAEKPRVRKNSGVAGSRAAHAFAIAVLQRRDAYQSAHDPAFWKASDLLAADGGKTREGIVYLFDQDFYYGTGWASDKNVRLLTGRPRETWDKLNAKLEGRANPRPVRKNGPTLDRPYYPFAEKEAQYAAYTDAQLHYALADAREAAKAEDEMARAGHGLSRYGWYADDVHTIAAEIRRRKTRKNTRTRKNGVLGVVGGFAAGVVAERFGKLTERTRALVSAKMKERSDRKDAEYKAQKALRKQQVKDAWEKGDPRASEMEFKTPAGWTRVKIGTEPDEVKWVHAENYVERYDRAPLAVAVIYPPEGNQLTYDVYEHPADKQPRFKVKTIQAAIAAADKLAGVKSNPRRKATKRRFRSNPTAWQKEMRKTSASKRSKFEVTTVEYIREGTYAFELDLGKDGYGRVTVYPDGDMRSALMILTPALRAKMEAWIKKHAKKIKAIPEFGRAYPSKW